MAHSKYEAILIPGGGVTEDGLPNLWVQNRLDRAAEVYKESGKPLLMPLSAGTPYKPNPVDSSGFQVFESMAGSKYLIDRHGIPPEKIWPEWCSYSTIGNAAFARWILTDPEPEICNLLVISSKFHMARTKMFFEWVFSLEPNSKPYNLDFETVDNVGLDIVSLEARAEKEEASMEYFRPLMKKITTLAQLHSFLFSKYPVYSSSRIIKTRPKITDIGSKSY